MIFLKKYHIDLDRLISRSGHHLNLERLICISAHLILDGQMVYKAQHKNYDLHILDKIGDLGNYSQR